MTETVAVLIPTLNRYDFLYDTIKSVRSISESVPIYICDQSPRPLDEVVKKIRNVKILFYYHVSFASLTKARNFLVKQCKEEICIFIDDDVRLAKEYFDEILDYFSLDDIVGVTGPSPRTDQHLVSREEVPDFEKLSKKGTLFNSVDFLHYPLWMAGCNHAFRKKDILKVGGYDEIFFGSAIGEDAEMSIRMQRITKKRLVYIPSMSLTHLQVPAGGCRDEKIRIKKISADLANALYQSYCCVPFSLGNYFRVLRIYILNKNLFYKTLSTVLIFGYGLFYCVIMVKQSCGKKMKKFFTTSV